MARHSNERLRRAVHALVHSGLAQETWDTFPCPTLAAEQRRQLRPPLLRDRRVALELRHHRDKSERSARLLSVAAVAQRRKHLLQRAVL
ncbi:hypothetical protein [Mumia zhuanghuii]|uniref:Uncharacterized protein n=1 Tax=Mumia zhuanghuii TaxID=2585211 RepID=A0A5C4MJR2_9ACTN|nr:hypothetical protein [Mumia zhuanghuii]TNC41845.1 hypothetical protein FHE65_21695 [Mumia zhuanghuii]